MYCDAVKEGNYIPKGRQVLLFVCNKFHHSYRPVPHTHSTNYVFKKKTVLYSVFLKMC